MLVKAFGSSVFGVGAYIVTVEVNIGKGAFFSLVGLPDNTIKESQYRIDAALKNNGYKIPRKGVTINMAPADLKKEGSAFDLTLALGILAADGKIENERLHQYIVIGELSLDGSLRTVKGVLPIAIEAKKRGFKGILLPKGNAIEASIVDGFEVIPIATIKEAIDFLNNVLVIKPIKSEVKQTFQNELEENEHDFGDVRGQENIKRALEISAAGGHNVILIGPPGAGKTMLAKRMPSILPPLNLFEALETTKIHSVAGKLSKPLVSQRPFRAPHHTVSDVALVGGGNYPSPGEISMAHNGVLFLDELPEFKRSVLEVLRQPLEDRYITISRARFSVDYPASFMLIASMNPCPCGFYNHPEKECVCSSNIVHKYMSKISGPLLDRIDLHIEVTPVPIDELTENRVAESSRTIRERVMKARDIQDRRFKESPEINCNAQMGASIVQKVCEVHPDSLNLLRTAMKKLNLSARAYDRILKVSRTIADLEEEQFVLPNHMAEAIQYRSLDRNGWSG